MKTTRFFRCDICKTIYSVTAHAAAFKRMTGGHCCARPECRAIFSLRLAAEVSAIFAAPLAGGSVDMTPALPGVDPRDLADPLFAAAGGAR